MIPLLLEKKGLFASFFIKCNVLFNVSCLMNNAKGNVKTYMK